LWIWLKPLQRQVPLGRRRPSDHERTVRGRIVPRLEALDDRIVPSTLLVTSAADDGTAGTLRAAITTAASGDTIQFAPGLARQTITLTQGELAITQSLDIEGLGASQLTISGNNASRVFDITASNASLTLAGLTISNGLSSYGSGITNVGTLTVNDCTLSENVANSSAGGAIDNSGTLIINNSTISGNRVDAAPGVSTGSGFAAGPGANGCGGGIYTSGGTVTINASTIADNAATGGDGAGVLSAGVIGPAGNGYGGGLYVASGTVSINNSTLAGNQAVGGFGFNYYASTGYGGGIENASGTVTITNSTLAGNQAIGGGNPYYSSVGYGGGINNDAGTVSIDNSTLADNQAVGNSVTNGSLISPGSGYGGGIYNYANAAGPNGVLNLYDTILADNTATCAPDLYGNVTSLGHNLIGNTTGGTGFVASDLRNVNPQLAPLQNNGGPTQTMALLPGSHAIDAGDNTGAPAYDQRGTGFARVVNGVIDIGAFEVQNGGSTQTDSLAVSGLPASIQANSSASFQITALNPDGTIDTGYTGTVYFTSSDTSAALPADYTFTAADAGTHPFSATLFTAGSQSITAADTTTAGLAGAGSITVTPGSARQVAFVQQPITATAGQTIGPAVVDVEDEYGNLVSSDSSTVTVTLSSGTFADGSTTASVVASDGVATFSSLAIDKASSYTLTANDGTLTPAVSASFSVTAAAASALVVSDFPSTTTAGTGHTFMVTAYDPYGNVATGYTGTVHLTSSDAKDVPPANYTFTTADAGKHTFATTLKTAGTQSITATDTANAGLTATDSGITVRPAAASKFVLTGPSRVSPGVPFSLTLTVEDDSGNIVTGYTGTVHFTSTDSTALLPANYAFTAGDAGVHTFTGLVLHKKGRLQKITVTDTLNSALTASDVVDVH
jgi:hypothetical protein